MEWIDCNFKCNLADEINVLNLKIRCELMDICMIKILINFEMLVEALIYYKFNNLYWFHNNIKIELLISNKNNRQQHYQQRSPHLQITYPQQ